MDSHLKMTARPQDVALLPLPDSYMASEFVHNTAVYGANQMLAYARANVTAALASAQAREESIVRQLRIETDRANAQYDRAERLEEALRSAEALAVCCMAIDGYSRMELWEMAEAMLPVYRAALSTNAAPQTGETT